MEYKANMLKDNLESECKEKINKYKREEELKVI